MAVPTSNAASPTGMPNGNLHVREEADEDDRHHRKADPGASHICAAGLIEMKVSEMPASVPSIAARGVSLRM